MIKRICCLGAGLIGGTTSSVIALKCPELLVTVVDEDSEKIMQWNSEKIPISEPGLDEMVKECRNKNLFFSTDKIAAIKDADLIFICVDIPPKNCGLGKGLLDLKALDKAARLITDVGIGDKIIVEKSTVPVKGAEIITKILKANHQTNKQVISNPEFICRGTALQDLLYPDRVLIGGDDTVEGKSAVSRLSCIYERWVPKEKIITTNTYSSELAKLATNAFLAQRLSSINSLSPICEVLGFDVSTISEIIGSDSRIGNKFLKPSIGFGGGGLRKDIENLIYIATSLGFPNVAEYWQQVLDMNSFQIKRFSQKIVESLFSVVADKKIAILGFAFKENVMETQESPAIYVCQNLLHEGAKLQIYDPKVTKGQILEDLKLESEKANQRSVTIYDDPYQCASNTHAIVICTGWDEFKTLDYERIFADMIKPAFIFDGKNILPHQDLINIGYYVECPGNCLSKPTFAKHVYLGGRYQPSSPIC